MSREEVGGIAKKLLQADEVIHERYLGVPRVQPKLKVADTDHAIAVVPQPSSLTKGKRAAVIVDESENAIRSELLRTRNPVVQAIMAMVAGEAGFLVDEKLLRLMRLRPAHEQRLLMLDTILKVFEIASARELEEFLIGFLQPAYHSAVGDLARSLGQKSMELLPDMLIDPNKVTQVLRLYMVAKRNRFQENEVGADEEQLQVAKQPERKTDAKIVEKVTGTMDSKASLQERFENSTRVPALDDRRLKSWEGIQRAMRVFHVLLESRKKSALEVQQLENENKEMRAMVGTYMAQEADHKLQVPPSFVIDHAVQELLRGREAGKTGQRVSK